MTDPKTIPAKYDPNRQANGHFAPGNRAGVSWASEAATKLKRLQSAWLSCATEADVLEVQAELKKMALTCQNPDVKLKAMVVYLDRTLGKPTDNVRLDVSSSTGPAPIVDLTDDDIRDLERVVRKIGPVYGVPDSDSPSLEK